MAQGDGAKGAIKRLIVAPHPDDEIFWCYSAVDDESTVVVVTGNGRLSETERFCSEKGAKLISLGLEENRAKDDELALAATLEDLVLGVEEVYIPRPTHHQDHNAVYRAARIALRPGRRLARCGLRLIVEYDYWGREEWDWNMISPVDAAKYVWAREVDRRWAEMVRAADLAAGAREGLPGPAERFRIILAAGAVR